MMPEREDRRAGEAAAQGVVQAEEPGGGGVPDEVGQRGDVHARRRDVRADPVDHQREEREEELPLELVVDGQIGDAGCGHLPLDLAAGRLDLRARRRGQGHAANRIGPVGVTGAQELDRARPASPMSPAAYSVSGLTSVALTFLSCDRFTTWAVTLNGLVKPRLGSRRYIGICPPSKPGLVAPPVRAL